MYLKNEIMFSLALRKKKELNDYFFDNDDYYFKECNINCLDRYWLADPFLFEKNEVIYLFYEAYDLAKNKGLLGYSVISEDGAFSPIKIIIEEEYHLSFPFVFEKDGDVFLMPESNKANDIHLYRAISFPDKWVKADTIVNNIKACDSVLLLFKGKNYLLTNELYDKTPNGYYRSCWVKNILYELQDLKPIDSGKLVDEGAFGQRGAGHAFTRDGKLYRIGQDCTDNVYGKGLVLFEIKNIDPYEESLVWAKDYVDFENHIVSLKKNAVKGVHTYNFSRHYEVIDFEQIRGVPFLTLILRRFYFWYNKYIKKIIYNAKYNFRWE